MDWYFQAILIAAIFLIGGMEKTWQNVLTSKARIYFLDKAADYLKRSHDGFYYLGTKQDEHSLSPYVFYTKNIWEETLKTYHGYFESLGPWENPGLDKDGDDMLNALALIKYENHLSSKLIKYTERVNKIVNYWIDAYEKIEKRNSTIGLDWNLLKKGMV